MTSQQLLVLLNVTVNTVLAVSATHLLLKVFGHQDSEIYKRPYAAVLCKLATCITVCGSVANIMVHEVPPVTECLLNVGVAMNFLWISFFYGTKKPKRQSAPKAAVPSKKPSNGRPRRA